MSRRALRAAPRHGGRARARRPAHLDGNRRRPAGETGTIAANPAAWGDVILARKETPTSYHLAVVVDDAAQGVTDVVRGRDLFHSTGSTVCCRRCSACRRRATTITA